ncbi:phosphoglycolate phosphatase-like HAD superfamily hydrolase [Scopulibacillus daqui]|uniref:Phosphoglycolate phosphatase-like HAD superfamily hydrolase n=1 Tax=Scopulibacillus daqui TaxID=1469162 RepID=A0ABS2Q076_9BACL|nr:HAD family hydrolase [Scopulibacillus daqui]MBM7644932.1 phosphoglycolate phosphatase-like HAD superfamily hydrolase [Scopulibacillus daqui]
MFKTILFDIDGVLLSEERYFDATALTVYELIYSSNYLGLKPELFASQPSEEQIRKIRSLVFDNDHVLHFMKSRGINANWDMVYLAFSYQLILLLEPLAKTHKDVIKNFLHGNISLKDLQTLGQLVKSLDINAEPDFPAFIHDFKKGNATKQALMTYLNDIVKDKIGLSTSQFSRNSSLWRICEKAFQEWYLGDEKFIQDEGIQPVQAGKPGFLSSEIPIVEPAHLQRLFQSLKDKGIKLGIGTGRPDIETIEPLASIGVLEYFNRSCISTATDVLKAEEEHPERSPLAKPQPFTYIAALLGKKCSDPDVLNHPLPIENGRDILIVGDSVADYYASQSMGCTFAAVLTGLSGQAARSEFEALRTDYILNNVMELLNIV